MGITKLLSIGNYREVDRFIGNDVIRNLMTKQRFQDNLQNLRFGNNGYDNKSDEGRAVYVMFFEIIQNILSSKLTTLLVKIQHGNNLDFRYSNVNIFQTCHMMT